MRYPNTRQELEEMIRRAFDVDRILPPAFNARMKGCSLSNLIVVPDDERSPEDVLEDLADSRMNITREDLALWQEVMFKWLPVLNGIEREVVKCRCRGMGWKRIGKHLSERSLSDRGLSRTTLWRIFVSGLERIEAHVYR